MNFISKFGPRPKVVVVGAGFAGISAIQTLVRRNLNAEITLVTKNNIFEYYPALYKLVTGALAIEVAIPLKRIKGLEKINLINGVFSKVEPGQQFIVLEDGSKVPYDYLVLALGSETNYFNIQGLAEFSYSFKSVREAFKLKRHFCELFASVANTEKKEAAERVHTVIVGGGPSGVELAGDLTHYLRSLAKSFKVDPSIVTVDLIESTPRILSMMPEKVSKLADARLRKMGVNIYTNRAVMSQYIDEVFLGSMQFKSHTVIWTAGTKINAAYDNVPNATLSEKKRIVVNDYLALPKDNNIFVVGDGAATSNSGLAQTAIHDGKYIGNHIFRLMNGKNVQKYSPPKVRYVIPIGNFWALFVSGNTVLKGILPWILRSAVDFRYFTSIVPFWYVLDVFRQGAKYRRSKTYCPLE